MHDALKEKWGEMIRERFQVLYENRFAPLVFPVPLALLLAPQFRYYASVVFFLIHAMSLSEEQLRLAKRIDEHTNHVLSDEAGYGPLFMSLPEYMEDFGRVMEISTPEEMNELCERYEGFYRFARFMEEFARGLADGSIPRMP